MAGRGWLEGRKAFIAGGGGTIGRAIAARLADEGAAVSLADRSTSRLDEVVREMRAAGHQPGSYELDITVASEVRRVVRAASVAMGGLDLMVNAAAISEGHRDSSFQLEDEMDETWSEVLAVNLTGTWYLARAAAENMDRGGAIVNISSRAADGASRNNPAYGASKAGVVNLTQSLAALLTPRGIRVNGVGPGSMEYRMRSDDNPPEARPGDGGLFGRPSTGADIASVVAFLLSEDAGYVTGVNLSWAAEHRLGRRG